MELIDINKEIVSLGTKLGFNVIDDKEYLKGGVVWIEDIYKSKTQGNKSNEKYLFYITLNIYETSTNKAKLYEAGKKLSDAMLNEFMVKNEEFKVNVGKKQEFVKKISMDIGKLYEYSFDFSVEAYRRPYIHLSKK